MESLIQILVVLATVMLTGLGVVSMFAPRRMIANFSIEPSGIHGLSTIRSVIGGLFIGCVSILAYSLVMGQTLGFVAVAILLGTVAMGRIVGIVLDGVDKAVVPPLIVEIAIITVLLTAHLQYAT